MRRCHEPATSAHARVLTPADRNLAIPRADRVDGIALSRAQRGLWLLDRLHPGSSDYNVPLAVRLTGPLDVAALERALERIVARHEVLRTVVRVVDGEPLQQFTTTRACPLPIADLSALGDADRERRSAELIDDWAHEPFDLVAGPLLRTRLIRLGERAHVLVLVMHHIVCDAASIHRLFDELADAYAGRPAPDPLPVQYADFAAWERARPVGDGDLAWWRQYLADAPATLALPADHPRPARRTTRGATHVHTLPNALADAAAALARRMRSTPFMITMAAYACLLGRLTGARELLLGTPVSARVDPVLAPLIGFFVNTLPVRVDLSGDPTFGDVAGRIRASLLSVLSHRQVPFDTLVESLQLERSPSHTPLVQTVFTFEPRPLAEPRLAGLDAELLTVRQRAAKFDLDFMLVQAADGSRDLELAINYSTDIFDATTIGALADRYERLLTAAVAAPDTPVRSLPVLGSGERRRLVGTWSATAPARRGGALVHELFARQATTTPSASALRFDGATMTYAELDARADRLARHLQARGVQPDDVVAVLLPRGPELIASLLAVMKSGAAYLPLDPIHPPDHVARVLAAAGCTRVLTDVAGASRLPGAGVEPLIVDALAADADAGPAPEQRAGEDHLAYVIFTSGSTGEPKGVGVTHRALANHAVSIGDRFGLGRDDRVLQFANIGFDVAAEEVFPTLLAGGCVVLCPDPPPPGSLLALLRREAIAVANLPASYWQRWVATLERAAELPPPSLRLLVVGSENVDAATHAWWRRATSVPVLNAYGLTETTITAAVHAADETVTPGATLPVGRPIDGAEAYVLDDELEPVPAGVEGELYVGGVVLARGYLARPDLTAERFVPHPFSARPGMRLHRTGDRARWRRDGALEVLGRADGQLKVRGYRIEPAQVEAALCDHRDVVRAAVAADGEGRLTGYVVTRAGVVPDDLRDHAAGRLPSYMVPDMLVALDELPTSASGKLDRAALPAPRIRPTAAPVAAGTDLESQLAELWQRALELDRVGIHDNFFDLGGTSFTLAAVHASLCDLLGRRIPLVTLYEHPTIAALARHLERAPERVAETTAGPAPAKRADRLHARRARIASLRRAA